MYFFFMLTPDVIYAVIEVHNRNERVSAHDVAVCHEKQSMGDEDNGDYDEESLDVFHNEFVHAIPQL